MAVSFKPDFTRIDEYLFHPRDITIKPELNGRHDIPDVESLIQSLLAVGQIEPVLVRNDGGTVVLIAGFSRWRAAVEINKRKLTPEPFRLRCVHFKGDEQSGVIAGIHENAHRNSTTAVDDAHNIARLERYGMTMDQMIPIWQPKDEFGHRLEDKKAVKWLQSRLDLISLSKKGEQAIKDGMVKPNAVKLLVKLSAEQQAEVIKVAKESGKAITAASLKPAKPKTPKTASTKPSSDADDADKFAEQLHALVRDIATKGASAIPFDWESDADARKFCGLLLKHISDG